MRRLPILLVTLVLGSAFAGADIVDVRELGDAQQPDIFIAFDRAPELLETRLDGRVLELEIAAVPESTRRILPAGNAWITSIETQAVDNRQVVRLELTRGASNLSVARTHSGLRLSWTPADDALSRELTANEAPVEPANITAATTIPISENTVTVEASTETAPELLMETEGAAQPSDTNQADCEAATAALEVDSWNIDALMVHAGCLMAQGAPADAIPLLERVVAFEPGRFDAVIALAEANETLGDVVSAHALYEQAATVAATDGQAVAARARARRLAN
ncbi:tetratricopeptide repeat protein [Hyphobacterium sp.]|uniref:tetratricopeptide repeat protein n=1 Tax=Hyphobacterium sp. TaxID=2004662 RepID=UPI003B517B68